VFIYLRTTGFHSGHHVLAGETSRKPKLLEVPAHCGRKLFVNSRSAEIDPRGIGSPASPARRSSSDAVSPVHGGTCLRLLPVCIGALLSCTIANACNAVQAEATHSNVKSCLANGTQILGGKQRSVCTPAGAERDGIFDVSSPCAARMPSIFGLWAESACRHRRSLQPCVRICCSIGELLSYRVVRTSRRSALSRLLLIHSGRPTIVSSSLFPRTRQHMQACRQPTWLLSQSRKPLQRAASMRPHLLPSSRYCRKHDRDMINAG